jgi:hypothetical protein
MQGATPPADRVDQWIRFFLHPDRAVQLRVLHALVGIDDPRVTAALLESFPRYGPYRGVVQALTRHRDPALVEPLLHHLTDPDLHVRAAACEALGILQDRRATPSLVARLDDTHLAVRSAAAFALADLRDPQSADALLRHWQERPEENINVRMGVRAALKALDIPYDERWGLHAQDQAAAMAPNQAETTLEPAVHVPAVVTREDLLWFMWSVHNTLQQLLDNGMNGYFVKATEPVMRKPTELPWKLGRSSGRRVRQRLKSLEADVLRTERRWPAKSMNLPPVIAEQGPRMLTQLKQMTVILEAQDDARLHQDDMHTAIRELQQFVGMLPTKERR